MMKWGTAGEQLAKHLGPEPGLQKPWERSGVMAYACSPSTRETKTALVHLRKSSLLYLVSSRQWETLPQKQTDKKTNKQKAHKSQDTRKDLWSLSLGLQKAPEAGPVSGVSLDGVPERPSCDAEMVMTEFCWWTQEIGDARAVGYLPRRTAVQVWNQPKKEACCSQQRRKELEIWKVL